MGVRRHYGDVLPYRLIVETGEAGDALAIALQDRPALGIEHAVLAEILQKQDARLVVGFDDLRRGTADFPLVDRQRNERIGVLGKMRALRLRLSVQSGRSFTTAPAVPRVTHI